MRAAADAPAACTLRLGDLQRRMDWIRRVTLEGLLSHRLDGSTLQLSYRRDFRLAIEQIVAAEQKRCPFLRFTLSDGEDAVLLAIEEPGGLGEDVRLGFDRFLPRPVPVWVPQRCGCAPGKCG